MKQSTWVWVLVVLLVAALAATGVYVVMTNQAQVAPTVVSPQDNPIVQSVERQRTYTIYGPTAVTTGTVNTASPNLDQFNRDMALTTGWSLADVFVGVDGTGTFTVTAKIQLSADGVSWADYAYDYESVTSVWESEGVTSTAEASTTIARHTPTLTFTTDGTGFLQAALAGERMRVQLGVTGAVTPTVKVTYRN